VLRRSWPRLPARIGLEARRAHQLGLGAVAGAPLRGLGHGPPHRRPQPGHRVLEDVVGGAAAQGLDRGLLAQGSGDEHERHALVAGAQQRQRLVAGERGQAEVGQHDVGTELVECGEVVVAPLDHARFHNQPVFAELVQHQFGVERVVLDQEHAHRGRGGGLGAAQLTLSQRQPVH